MLKSSQLSITIATIILFTLLATIYPVQAAKSDKRPNILLIMVDDLGFSDFGCYGSEIKTPNIDQLADNGLRFSQFYNTAKCHSSRVSLLTGLYCYQAGNVSLNRGVTIAEVLKEAGYFTAMTGKWHLKNEPTDKGFMRYFGHLSGATNFFVGDKTFRLNGKPWSDFDKDFYTTDANTDYAIQFMDEALKSDQPFFMYIAHNAPHYPLQAKKSDFMKYQGKYDIGWDKLRQQRYKKQLEQGIVKPQWKLSPRPTEVKPWNTLSDEDKQWESDRMAAFAGMVDCIDQNMGKLVNFLKKRGELDNTIILLCSDNGACPFERTRGKNLKSWDPKSYWTYDTGWAHAGNTPFRWYKQNQHEGGISSPLIVHWPDGLTTKAGAITYQPGHIIDVMATCLELGKATYPTTFQSRTIEPLQGKSLLPILKNTKREDHDWLYFQFANNRAIRKGDWKLVSARGRAWELYNVETDRSELNNLVKDKPAMAEELKALWHKIARDVEKAPAKMRKPVKKKRARK